MKETKRNDKKKKRKRKCNFWISVKDRRNGVFVKLSMLSVCMCHIMRHSTAAFALYGLSRREIAETRRRWVFYIYFCSVESLLRSELSQAYGPLMTAVDMLKERKDKFFSRIMKTLFHYVLYNWRSCTKEDETSINNTLFLLRFYQISATIPSLLFLVFLFCNQCVEKFH